MRSLAFILIFFPELGKSRSINVKDIYSLYMFQTDKLLSCRSCGLLMQSANRTLPVSLFDHTLRRAVGLLSKPLLYITFYQGVEFLFNGVPIKYNVYGHDVKI